MLCVDLYGSVSHISLIYSDNSGSEMTSVPNEMIYT